MPGPPVGTVNQAAPATAGHDQVTFTEENGQIIENIVNQEMQHIAPPSPLPGHEPAFVPVTYTTKSGEVVVTKKMLRHEPSFVLSETPNAPTLGVAILGYRRFGRKHLKDVVENSACEVKFIMDYDPQLAEQAQADVKSMGVKNCQVLNDKNGSLEKIMKSSSVQLILISTKQERKKEFVTAALKAGKTCLCDKPLAKTAKDVKELFELARVHNCILLTNLPGRPGKAFSPVIMSLISSASNITAERLKSATDRGADHSKAPAIDPNSEETHMMLLDVAMHDAFAINFCMCMRPTSVSAIVSPDAKNVCEVSLSMPNGCKIVIKSSYGQEELDVQQFTLFGERLSDMRRVDHMNMRDMRKNAEGSVDTAPNDVKGIRFTQVYDSSNRDALEQCYAFSAGHKELAMRVRPQLMEQNVLDCIVIADAALESIKSGGKEVAMTYW